MASTAPGSESNSVMSSRRRSSRSRTPALCAASSRRPRLSRVPPGAPPGLPLSANSAAVSSPMPLELPDTTATFSSGMTFHQILQIAAQGTNASVQAPSIAMRAAVREDNRFVHSFMKRTDNMPTSKKQGNTNAAKGEIAPAKGKLGIMIPGMGAVATTFVAGVEAVRRGISSPIGSLTQMGTVRLGKRTEGRFPKINEFVPLAGLNDLVFTGWDIFEDNMY